MIKVVCGILLTEDKILVTQRSEKMSHPGKWEFPGGKINENETEEDALIRELKEELNITVRPLIKLYHVIHKYGDKKIELIPFICLMSGGELQLKEHSSVQKVDIDHLPTLDWVEADVKIVDQLSGMKEKMIEIMKNKSITKDTTLVLGASPKPDRYSNMAVNKLKLYNHPVIAVGITKGMINGTEITTDLEPYRNIHTVTLYVSPQNQNAYFNYILSLQPERVIFNPGTENPEFYQILKENKIEYLEACTLVMLSTGQY